MGWHPVVGAGGGIAISNNLGSSEYFPANTTNGLQFFNYSNQSGNQTRGLFEVFLGAEHALFSDWLFQGGVAYSQAEPYMVKGILTQGVDVPSAEQFNYNYSALTRQIMAQGKLMYPMKDRYYPYFLLGLGAWINSSSNYSTSIPANALSTRVYPNSNPSSFAYRVGAGVDVDVWDHIRVGVAYRFLGNGAIGLGNATLEGVSVPGTLAQNNFNTNEVLFQLTYII